jgi:acyl carrier protein
MKGSSVTENDRLTTLFREVLDDESIELRDDLTADEVENWDSLAHINLLFRLEQEFSVSFNGNEAASLSNVGELRALLGSKGVEL